MSLSLAEVLELEAVARARPELLHGQHLLHRPVRWVHTSELAEAAYLLKGGELLLTTGLGLAGRGSVGETAYIEALAARGVAALLLELGWTFAHPPPALVAAARDTDLALLVLHEIVPFVEITEQIQTALLERSAAATRQQRGLRERLTDALLAGAGPAELTAILAGHLAAPVVVTSEDGAIAEVAGLRPGRRPRRTYRREIVVLDRRWGHLDIHAPAQPTDPAVLDACAAGTDALEMALLRSATGDDLAARRRRLLDDLVLERFSSVGDLVARCRVLGLAFAAGADYLALLVRGLPVDDLPHAARAIEHALAPAPALVAELGNDVVAITTSATDPARAVLAAIEPRRPPSSVRIVVGPPASLTTISRSVSDARAALDLADRLNLVEPCLAAASLTPQILLSELINHPSARRLVDDQLGPLLEHDQLRDTSLTRTLRTYLAHGSNKVAAARALHVRRQTMYQRLARIVELIGDIQLPHRHTGLVVALELAALTERATGAKSRPTQSVPTATPGPPARSPGAGRDDQA